MTRWTRVQSDTLCGHCPHLIRRGDPVLEIRIVGVKSVKRRCVACAGEPVPDLPAWVERQPIQPTAPVFTPVRQLVGTLPFDYKARQIGEREPGEDG